MKKISKKVLTNRQPFDIMNKLSTRERQTILENDTENEQEAKQSIRDKLSETLVKLRVLAHLKRNEIVD